MPKTSDTAAARRVADSAARRIMSERRWRVLVNVTVFVLATGAMVLLSMSHRDSQAIQTCREQMDYTCQELQKLLAAGEMAPRSLPLPLPPEPGDGCNGRRTG